MALPAMLNKLEDVTFAVVDLETTGFDMKGSDRIIEIAVVRAKLGADEPLQEWSRLVNPTRKIPFAATEVNHITNLMVQNQPTFAEVAEELLAVVENCVLVFHNASFDLPFLQIELARAGFDWSGLPELVLDTCELARHNYKFGSNKLGALISELGLEEVGKPDHRALNDTRATWNLLGWLVADLRKQNLGALETVEDLMKLQERRVLVASGVKIHSQETVTIETNADANHWVTNIESETDTSVEFFQLGVEADTVFEQWQSGELPINVALPTLCSHFARLDDLMKLLEEQVKTMRNQISFMVEATGGKAEIPQFGKLRIDSPQVVTSFDRKQLEQLVARLINEGNQEIAAAIDACKAQTNRAGGLRIIRASGKKPNPFED